MTTTTHSGTIHIDAPVEQVFDHVREPANFYGAMPDRMSPGSGVRAVQMTPEGIGTTYEWIAGHIAGFQLVGVITREEYVENERIVDASSTGPTWTWSLEPEDDGTRASLRFEFSTKVPFLDKIVDAINWRGDEDIESILATIKKEVEA